MNSRFVRFSQFVRSPLPLATLSLCLLWGCRHLPSSRYATECPSTAAVVTPNAAVNGGYEEPSAASVISSNPAEAPIVSLSEDDVFLPVPKEPASPAPTAANAPATVPTERIPMSVAEQKVTPAPVTTKELELDDLPANSSALTPKLEVPPEPAPKTAPTPKEIDEPQADLLQQSVPQASSAVSDAPTLPQIEPARPGKALSFRLDNEVFSLDSYCNGLVFDAQGFGYVSHKDRILRFSPTGDSKVWVTLSSPKGHRIEPEGTHLICDVERHAVLRLSFEGKVVGVAAKECDGVPFRAPYDIAVDPQGGFYFTDPGYVQVKNPIGKLHYVDRTGKVLVVAAKIGYPTGVVYDPARQRVLVAESQFNRVLEFRLSEPGKVASHEVLVQLPTSPDSDYHLASLCLDAEGNLYVTQQQTKAIHVFDSLGRPIGRFSTSSVVPSSLAFRSPNGTDELFVAGDLDARPREGKVIRLNLGR